MSQIQFPGTLSAEFDVDQVTDPNGAPAEVLDLDLGFAVKGHIDFPNWLAGKGNVSIYADQRGGGYDQKILQAFPGQSRGVAPPNASSLPTQQRTRCQAANGYAAP
jgi:hypothetical protein